MCQKPFPPPCSLSLFLILLCTLNVYYHGSDLQNMGVFGTVETCNLGAFLLFFCPSLFVLSCVFRGYTARVEILQKGNGEM